MFGPAGLSRPLVDRLYNTIAAALNTPEVQKYHNDNGSQILADAPEQLSEKLKADMEKVGRLIRRLNIQVE